MKTPRIVNAIGYIDDNLINGATKSKKAVKKNVWVKWSSFAACFVILLIVAVVALPTFFGNGNTTLPIVSKDTTSQTNSESTTQPVTSNEAAFFEAYLYNVSDGEFSNYVSGKVIAEDKIGGKIDDVSVSAGWKNSFDEWLTTETLRAEVYLISDISKDVAVALKFIDKGDALTTTHYYVIMNPDADLTAVNDYVIIPTAPNNPSNEVYEEVVGNEIAEEEIVVEYTSQFTSE